MDQVENAVLVDIDVQFIELVTRHSLINKTMALENHGFSNELCLKLALLTLVNGSVVVRRRYKEIFDDEM